MDNPNTPSNNQWTTQKLACLIKAIILFRRKLKESKTMEIKENISFVPGNSLKRGSLSMMILSKVVGKFKNRRSVKKNSIVQKKIESMQRHPLASDVLDYFLEETKSTRLRQFFKRYTKIKFLIFPDDPFASYWNIVVTISMLYVAIILPYQVAFVEDSVYSDASTAFYIIELIINFVFAVDMVVNFISAYYNEFEELIVNRRSWFLIDLIATIPFSVIIESVANYNTFARLIRLPRLITFVKMARLVRLTKVVHERNRVKSFFKDLFKIQASLERFTIAVIIIVMSCHLATCFWYLSYILFRAILINSEFYDPDSWDKRFYTIAKNDFGIHYYIASLHFTLQTAVTTGYGDLNAFTTEERIFAIGWMFLGGFIYSFVIGSLTSVLSNVDSKRVHYQENLKILLAIKKEYDLKNDLFDRINKALKYETNSDTTNDYSNFLRDLPQATRIELILAMNENIISKIQFFQRKSGAFLAEILPLLRKVKIEEGEFIYMKNDPAHEVYFVVNGAVNGVIPQFSNDSFITIREGLMFGELDIIFNGEKRQYTMMTKIGAELLALSKKDFKKIVFQDFRTVAKELFQIALKKRNAFHVKYRHTYDLLKQKEKSGRRGSASGSLTFLGRGSGTRSEDRKKRIFEVKMEDKIDEDYDEGSNLDSNSEGEVKEIEEQKNSSDSGKTIKHISDVIDAKLRDMKASLNNGNPTEDDNNLQKKEDEEREKKIKEMREQVDNLENQLDQLGKMAEKLVLELEESSSEEL